MTESHDNARKAQAEVAEVVLDKAVKSCLKAVWGKGKGDYASAG